MKLNDLSLFIKYKHFFRRFLVFHFGLANFITILFELYHFIDDVISIVIYRIIHKIQTNTQTQTQKGVHAIKTQNNETIYGTYTLYVQCNVVYYHWAVNCLAPPFPVIIQYIFNCQPLSSHLRPHSPRACKGNQQHQPIIFLTSFSPYNVTSKMKTRGGAFYMMWKCPLFHNNETIHYIM